MANRPAPNEQGKTRSSILFQDFQNLQRIWTHPRVLRYNSDRFLKKKLMASDDEEGEEGSLKDFIDDEDDDSELDNSSSDSSSSSNDSSVQSVHSDKPSNSKAAIQRRTRATAKDCEYIHFNKNSRFCIKYTKFHFNLVILRSIISLIKLFSIFIK